MKSSRTLGDVQYAVAIMPKKNGPKRTSKIQKGAEELAKRKAEMMAPENSVLVMRSASPPPILSLSVQVEDLEEIQSEVDNGIRKVLSSNPMAYAKAAEAAEEAAERLRRANLLN